MSGGQAPSPVRQPAAKKSGQAGAPVLHKSADDVQSLFERLQKARPLLAGYLAGAKTMRKEGNRVIWTFDDAHLAQPLIDAKTSLEQIAAEVYGGPTSIQIETETTAASAGSRSEERPSALREDPIVKAFQKHLGGEIDSRKR